MRRAGSSELPGSGSRTVPPAVRTCRIPTGDVTRLRASATISVGKAQKLFGTKWNNYQTAVPGQVVALPAGTPKLPKGLKGNVDVIAGLRYTVKQGSSSSARSSRSPAVA